MLVKLDTLNQYNNDSRLPTSGEIRIHPVSSTLTYHPVNNCNITGEMSHFPFSGEQFQFLAQTYVGFLRALYGLVRPHSPYLPQQRASLYAHDESTRNPDFHGMVTCGDMPCEMSHSPFLGLQENLWVETPMYSSPGAGIYRLSD